MLKIDPYSTLQQKVSCGPCCSPIIIIALRLDLTVVLSCGFCFFSSWSASVSSGTNWRGNAGIRGAVFSMKDQYLASLSFITLTFFLSRICLSWRITTGDLQLACFENQGFLLTCQRKWRKYCQDETYWCAHSKDKLLSLGQAWDPLREWQRASRLCFLPALSCLSEEIWCQLQQPRNQNLCVLSKGLAQSLTVRKRDNKQLSVFTRFSISARLCQIPVL